MKKVVVTGAGGYIGSQLVRDLLELDSQVLAVDRFFFGIEPLAGHLKNKNLKILKKDIRDLEEKDFSGYNAVCDLASLSNDPSGEIDPKLTYEINRDGRIHVAQTAKSVGISKYILSSSCSVYGTGGDSKLDEQSQINPISVYAKSTAEAENSIFGMSNSDFSTTALRNATVFGLSNRMRFDLVVNLMTLTAFQKSRIIVMGGGLQWRPLVHLKDVSRAFIKVIEAPVEKINNQVLNIGLSNYKVLELAQLIKSTLPIELEIDVAPDDSDKRDYNVNFDKAKLVIDFEALISIEEGVKEIFHALVNNKVDTGPKTVTVKWYQNIIESKRLVEDIQLNGRLI